MAINKIQHHLFAKRTDNNVIHLKEGQIVKGKIIKLYSDHRAEIRIGTTTLIAQLETSLSVGNSYYFQVQEKHDQIYLQVVQGDRYNGSPTIHSLMKQLQIKETSMSTMLIDKLITNGVPFNRTQIVQALQLLQSSSQTQREAAMDVLQRMIETKLPITHSVFQAISSLEKNDFTTTMTSLYTALQLSATPLNESEQTLLQLLRSFIQRPDSGNVEYTQMLLDKIKNNESVFNMFRLLGLFDATLDHDEVIIRLQQYIETKSIQHYPLQQVTSEAQLQQITSQAKIDMKQLLLSESKLISAVLKAISIYHPIQTASLNQNEFHSFIQLIQKEVMPLLPLQTQQSFLNILNPLTVNNQASILPSIQAFTNPEVYSTLSTVTTNFSAAPIHELPTLAIQQQLVAHITNYMQTIGLTMEHEIIQAIQSGQEDFQGLQTKTMKSILLQMLQQGGFHQEQVQQLLHFINGTQLQSLTETNQMYQAQLLIPGNKFELNQDIWLQFESKKTPDKTIDTDYCRIIFVLDLKRLQETIVDMQIQKRIITVSIFNDLVTGVENMDRLYSDMKKNLENLDYQLSTIQWKPLSDNNEVTPSSTIHKKDNHQQEGFDFRI